MFHPRCAFAREACVPQVPSLEPDPRAPTHTVACTIPHELRPAVWARLSAGEEPPAVAAATGLVPSADREEVAP